MHGVPSPDIARRLVVIRGIVQGVGFRPFVHGLAHDLSLSGSIRNVGGGVRIEIEGPDDRVASFVRRVRAEAPPLAVIDQVEVTALAATGVAGPFLILDERRPV